jgi:hypothetical protein
MHGANGIQVLSHDRLHRAATLLNVSLESPDEADVVIGLDVDAKGHSIPKRLIGKDKHTLDQNDIARVYPVRFGSTAVLHEVVRWNIDWRTAHHQVEMLDQVKFGTFDLSPGVLQAIADGKMAFNPESATESPTGYRFADGFFRYMAFETDDPSEVVQPIAERARIAADMSFIVVMAVTHFEVVAGSTEKAIPGSRRRVFPATM